MDNAENIKKVDLAVDFFAMIEGVSRREYLERIAKKAMADKEWRVMAIIASLLAKESEEKES